MPDGVPPGGGLGGSSVEETLFHAALLAGKGARAAAVARDAAALVATTVDGRSCLEAGARVQLTMDAPGGVGLRFGIHLEGDIREPLSRAVPLLTPADAAALSDAVARLGPHAWPPRASLGAWLFHAGARSSLFLDARDGSPRAAAERVRPLLDGAGAKRLDRAMAVLLDCAEPWALRLEAVDGRLERVHLHWLLRREREPRPVAEALGVAAEWGAASEALARLVRRPTNPHAGPWVVATPLDGATAPGLRVATSAWARLRDDDRKRDDLLHAFERLGGARDHLAALWSLLTSAQPPSVRWRVGRAIEARALSDGTLRLRAFLVPRC